MSYYGKKLPDDTFSFDISNQKVQANLDEFGTIRHITFFHGNYLMESKPGVWVAKDFVQEHQLSVSVKMEWTDRKNYVNIQNMWRRIWQKICFHAAGIIFRGEKSRFLPQHRLQQKENG